MRVELGEPFFITCQSPECLSVYPKEEWDIFSEKLNKIPQSAVKAQRSIRMIFANAVKCEPDKQGRVLLPAHLREKVGIDKEVVTIGLNKIAEIFAKDKWYGFEEDFDDSETMANLEPFGV